MPERHASSAAAVSTCRAGAAIARADPEAAARRVRVLLPLPLPEALDYRIRRCRSDAGARQLCPRAARRAQPDRRRVGWRGVELAPDRLKPVAEILPLPPLGAPLRRFIERVADYTMAPPGAVLRMAMSVAEALPPPRPRRLCAIPPAGLAALADAAPGAR